MDLCRGELSGPRNDECWLDNVTNTFRQIDIAWHASKKVLELLPTAKVACSRARIIMSVMKRKIAAIAVILVGTTALLLAVFASQVGLDHNAGWGTGRILLAASGVLLILVSTALLLFPTLDFWADGKLKFSGSMTATYVIAALAFLAVIAIYVWYVSVGYWTIWPKTTYAYDLLASSFGHGQLALQDRPDPALLALPDPYDVAARGDIRFLWDASLYGGQYYLYFGPVPGLLLSVVKAVFPGQIPDQYLVFAFTCGLFVFSGLLVLSCWQRFFRQLPGWTLHLSLLMVGLVCPVVWILSRPAVYEAAIVGSQFFFIGGFYFSYTALSQVPRLFGVRFWQVFSGPAQSALGRRRSGR